MSAVDQGRKPTLTISIPTDSRDAFYEALAVLKRNDDRLFTSASALIVQAVLETAGRVKREARAVRASSARRMGRAQKAKDAAHV
jgi:hypothetical protein